MDSSTGTAVLARLDRSELIRPTCPDTPRSPAAERPSGPPSPFHALPGEPVAPAEARTAAGARAMRRRRARLAADRRPPSGMVPSSVRRSAVVAADHGDEVDDRVYLVSRWVRLACTLCFTATAVLVAVVLLSSGSTQVVGSVVVQPGDTLWSVAQRAEPGADPRTVVDRIKELNGLRGDAIVAGAVLQVPTTTP